MHAGILTKGPAIQLRPPLSNGIFGKIHLASHLNKQHNKWNHQERDDTYTATFAFFKWQFIVASTPTTVPWTTVPFFSSIATCSRLSFCRNLTNFMVVNSNLSSMLAWMRNHNTTTTIATPNRSSHDVWQHNGWRADKTISNVYLVLVLYQQAR